MDEMDEIRKINQVMILLHELLSDKSKLSDVDKTSLAIAQKRIEQIERRLRGF